MDTSTVGVEQGGMGKGGKGQEETTLEGKAPPIIPGTGKIEPGELPEHEMSTTEAMVGMEQPEMIQAGQMRPTEVAKVEKRFWL